MIYADILGELQAGQYSLQARLQDASAETAAAACRVACAPGPLSLPHCRGDASGLARWRAGEEGCVIIRRLDRQDSRWLQQIFHLC